jgi:hypothetical protein
MMTVAGAADAPLITGGWFVPPPPPMTKATLSTADSRPSLPVMMTV